MNTIIELLSRRFSSKKWINWSITNDPEIITMIDKLEGRKLAESLNIPVPKLLYSGSIELFDWNLLPQQYVLKSNRGSALSRVLVIDNEIDILRKIQINRNQLYNIAASWGSPIIIEEFIQDSLNYKPPIDYKLFVFGEYVDSIMLFDRTEKKPKIISYNTDWKRIPSHMNNKRDGSDIPKPDLLLDLISAASRIGKFFQTFLRVDMYCSTEGIVFGELCCNPCSGRYFSDLTNKHFGKMWEQHLNPNAL